MQNAGKVVKVRKVILFTVSPRLKEIGEKLEESGVEEVVRVLSIGGSDDLVAAIRKHKDAGALIVYGAVIRSTLLLIVRKIRTLTKAPILLVMMEKIPQGREQELRAVGVTEVLAKPDVIDGYEVMEAFDRMVARLPPPRPRPHLRLVRPDERAGQAPISAFSAETVGVQAATLLSMAGNIERVSVNLRKAAESMLPDEKRQHRDMVPPEPDPDDTGSDLIMRPSNGRRGPNVTLHGRRFHLTDPQCHLLGFLYRNKAGAYKEQMYGLPGMRSDPMAVSVAIANLRRRLLDTDPYWQNVVQCINGRYVLDFDRLSGPK